MQPGSALAVDEGAPSKTKQIAALLALNLFLVLISPYVLLHKLSRAGRKRRRHELDWRRWAIADVQPGVPLATGPGPRVVLVGPAFGELRLIESVSRRLKEQRGDLNIIWCIRDLVTIEMIKKAHPDQPVVIWPFDNFFPASKWASKVRPDVVVILEKFWLPNLLSISRMRGARTAVINGRTGRRDRFWDRIKSGYYRWVAHNVDLFCLQSPLFLDRLQGLLRPSGTALVTGNMKIDLETANLDEERQDALREWLDSRGSIPLLAAGSTAGPEDESFVLEAFKGVRRANPCALLLAPRRLHRVEEVVQAVEAAGFSVSRRSNPKGGPADVYVLDTLGELATAYRYVRGTFIGGTLTGTGHNVIEPVAWGSPVAYGPRRGHFQDLQLLCEKFGVGFRCSTSEELAAHWRKLLSDPKFGDDIRERAKRLMEHAQGATDRTVDALLALIDTVKPASY